MTIVRRMMSREEAEQYWPLTPIVGATRETEMPLNPLPIYCLSEDYLINLRKTYKKGWFRMFFRKRKELEQKLEKLQKEFHQLANTVAALRSEFIVTQEDAAVSKVLNGNISHKKFMQGWDTSDHREKMKEDGYILEGCVEKGRVEIWVKRGKVNG